MTTAKINRRPKNASRSARKPVFELILRLECRGCVTQALGLNADRLQRLAVHIMKMHNVGE